MLGCVGALQFLQTRPTKKNGTRDGLLMVVSKDLTRCVPVTDNRLAGELQKDFMMSEVVE